MKIKFVWGVLSIIVISCSFIVMNDVHARELVRWNSKQTKGDISVTLSGNLFIDKGTLDTEINGRIASSSPNLNKITKVINNITVEGYGIATGKAKIGKIYSKNIYCGI